MFDGFSCMIQKLDEYFAKKHHDTFERLKESLNKFLLRAKMQAGKCQFGISEVESRNIAVLDKIVMHAPTEFRRKILEKAIVNLDELANLVNTHLSVQHQVSELNQSASLTGNVWNSSRASNTQPINKISAANH